MLKYRCKLFLFAEKNIFYVVFHFFIFSNFIFAYLIYRRMMNTQLVDMYLSNTRNLLRNRVNLADK